MDLYLAIKTNVKRIKKIKIKIIAMRITTVAEILDGIIGTGTWT